MHRFFFFIFLTFQSHRTWRRLSALFALVATLTTLVADATAADVNLLGRSRSELEEVLGKPNSRLRRGDGEVLVFGDGVRIEMRDDRVVSVRGGSFGEIIVGDGIRYTIDEKGKATSSKQSTSVVQTEPAPLPEVAVASSEPATTDAATLDATVAEEATVAEAQVVGAGDLALVHAAEHPEEALATSNPAVARLLAGHDEEIETADREPPGAAWVGTLTKMVLHLTVVLVILAVALKWLGLPYVWSDLAKVGVLTVAVREGLHGLGGLGGNWEMLRLFRIDEVISFIALAVALFRFKVVLTGLTALKVAAATKSVAYMLMIGVGVALTFGMLAVH